MTSKERENKLKELQLNSTLESLENLNREEQQNKEFLKLVSFMHSLFEN